MISRARWHTRTSLLVFSWLFIACIVFLLKVETENAGWLLLHVILLGAVTNAIFIWSWHFAMTLLFLPDRNEHRHEIARISVLNVGILLIFGGQLSELELVSHLGDLVVLASVLLLIFAFYRGLRRALPSRFSMVVKIYGAASGSLVLGILIGLIISSYDFNEGKAADLLLAHITLNLLGFVGITIFATLLTFGPTLLRTHMIEGAALKARFSFRCLLSGTLLTSLGFIVNLRPLALFGLVTYLIGCISILIPLFTNVRRKSPENFASWTVLFAVIWTAVAIVIFIGTLISNHDSQSVLSNLSRFAFVAIFGGLIQIVLGSLSYLLPTMIGGGPSLVRRRNQIANRNATLRIVFGNGLVIASLFIAPSLKNFLYGGALIYIMWIVAQLMISARPQIKGEESHLQR